MNAKKLSSLIKVGAVALAMLLCCCACASPNDTISISDLDYYDLQKYLEPVWENNYVYCESALVLKNENGEVPPIGLLYDIESIVSVRDFSLETLYSEGTDYTVEDGKLVILETGAIYSDIAINYNEYYFDEYTEGANWLRTNGGGTLKTEVNYGMGGLTEYQIAVSYTHGEQKVIQTPQTKADKLPKTLAKLQSGEKTNIVLLGDSISAGWSASGYQYCNILPFCPNYFGMFTDCLSAHFDNDNINAANYSVGGMTSAWGAEEEQINHIVSEDPDLVLIAFGGNDGVAGGLSVKDFKANHAAMIEAVRESCPDAEFIIVSPMMPNSDVSGMLTNTYNYLEALKELESEYENVALADVSSVHVQILLRKTYADMSGNNINHPNDFMHRVYAQVILKTMLADY